MMDLVLLDMDIRRSERVLRSVRRRARILAIALPLAVMALAAVLLVSGLVR